MSPERPPLVVATGNRHKLAEIREILADVPFAVRSLADHPEVVLPEEGADYEANAVAKARAAAAATGDPALGDDSGLEVEGLGGAPGVHSARFAGPDADDAGRLRALLAALRGRDDAARRARMVCCAALVMPDGEVVRAWGEVSGRILEAPRGEAGFGYDPIFGVEGSGRAMAELAAEEKNRISHRGRAFAVLRRELLRRELLRRGAGQPPSRAKHS